MEAYPARKRNMKSRSNLISIAVGLLFAVIGVLILNLNLLFGALFILFGLLLLASQFLGERTYTLAERELVVTAPILHRKSFSYSDIESVEKIDSMAAGKIVEEVQWQFENASRDVSRLAEVVDSTYLTLYCTPGDVTVKSSYGASFKLGSYGPVSMHTRPMPTKIEAITLGDFILIKVRREGTEPIRYLLTPENMDSFINALRAKIGK